MTQVAVQAVEKGRVRGNLRLLTALTANTPLMLKNEKVIANFFLAWARGASSWK